MAWLRYKMDLTKGIKLSGTNLVAGKLEILDSTGKLLATYDKTTSGQPGYQKPANQYDTSLGPIPSCRTAGLSNWKVSATSYSLATPGVNGEFFSISPSPHTFGGVTRSEFGIHFDANFSTSQGSAGCVVFIDTTQWNNFQTWMKNYRTTYSPGATTINLIVEYA
jgi:hypothetical protein